jgi:hypothetical protein
VTDRLCSVPGCNRPHRAHGLCSSHYKARSEGRALTPLRELADVRREVVSMRVSPECREAVRAKPDAARVALERWARRA